MTLIYKNAESKWTIVTWMTIIKLDTCNIIVMVMPCHIIIYAMVKSISLIGLRNHVVKYMLNNYKQM